jgi:hypothetical protein
VKFISKLFLGLTLCLFTLQAAAQTTSAINGTVTDSEGGPLPGAVVTATHQPTGANYSTVTRADGRYNMGGLRVGGPYSIVVSMTGFNTGKENNVFLKLSENRRIDFKLTPESVEETLVVVASSNPIINSSRTGAFDNVSTESLEKLPTLNRSLSDMARTSPLFDQNRSTGALSVGGRNNRYNSIQIDGAANTDLFGLASSNTPGGQTESQPISLDAVQEVELIVSPYHIKYNGFTGGGINVVSRSGTNDWSGSAYGFYRDKDYVGDGPSDVPFGEFENSQIGFRLGGPIVKDKVFLFVNAEMDRQDQPSPWLVSAEDEQDSREFGHLSEVQEFDRILRNVYGYDPGGYGEFTRATDADHFFVRMDFNINETHQLTARHNFVDSLNDSRERSRFDFEFEDGFYRITDETNSTVLQLNSTFGGFVNEARLAYTTIKDRRGGLFEPFPYVEVRISDGRDLRAGMENFSTANALDQDILELNDEMTVFKGRHQMTFGVNAQFISFKNLFIQDAFGNYRFSSLADFEAGVANRIRYSYALPGQSRTADVDVNQFGLYAGDEFQINDNLNLVYGVRVDVPYFKNDPSRNPVTEQVFGVATNQSPDGNMLWSPRIGFNWDIKGDGTSQLRGGIGIFSGRPVYVWLSNNYSNTGVEFARLEAFGDIPFNPDPNNQPTDLSNNTQDATDTEFNLVDPDFKYPQVLRTSVGYDQELPWWGMIGTADVVYTDNLEAMLYRNLNLQPVGTFSDGRTVMGPVNADYGNAYYLTNTDKGYSWNATLKLERPSKDGLYWTVAYTRGKSRALLDATSSRAVSNYRNLETSGNSNENTMGYSDFDIKHRYLATVSYTKDFIQGSPTTVSMYYNLRSGRPYSTTYFDDVNGDRNSFNDLIYVPVDENDIILTTDNWADLDAYISGDPALDAARGTIIGRNASREPWSSVIDFRIAQDIAISKYKLQLSLDIQNLGNLIDKNSGNLPATNFNNLSVLGYEGTNENGQPTYSFFESPEAGGGFDRTGTNDTLSRWYMKFGARLNF